MTRTEAYAKLWRLLQEHPGSVYAVAVRGDDCEVDTVFELTRLIRSRLFAGAKIVSEHTRREEKMRTGDIALVNPWNGSDAKRMTWAEIVTWCESNVHESSREEWLREAGKAFDSDDGATLGKMIIGS